MHCKIVITMILLVTQDNFNKWEYINYIYKCFVGVFLPTMRNRGIQLFLSMAIILKEISILLLLYTREFTYSPYYTITCNRYIIIPSTPLVEPWRRINFLSGCYDWLCCNFRQHFRRIYSGMNPCLISNLERRRSELRVEGRG